MRKMLIVKLVFSMLVVSTMLSGCIVVPWDDGYGYHHHHGGYYGRR